MANDERVTATTPLVSRYRFATFELDEATRRLWRGSQTIDLPPRAFELLLLLLRHPGRVYRREEIFATLWPGVIVGDAALTQTISQLRRALEDADRQLIRTVSKSGYAFDGAVDVVAIDAARAPAIESATSLDAAPSGAMPASISAIATPPQLAIKRLRQRLPSRSRAQLLSIGALALILAITGIWLAPKLSGSETATPLVLLEPPSVASTGAAESWLDQAMRGILSAERLSDSRFELEANTSGRHAARAEATYRLSTHYVLDGPAGARRVKVDWQLYAPSGKTWQWQDDVASDDVQALSDLLDAGLAQRIPGWQRIADPIAGEVAEAALKRFSEGMLAAHDYRYAEARSAFEQALAISPDFVVARYQLALALNRLGYGDLAIAQARRALQQPDPNHETHRMLTIWLHELSNEYADAVVLLQRMLAQQPANIGVRLRLAFDAIRAHRLDQAAEALAALDPARLAPTWATRWYSTRSQLDSAGGNFRAALANAQRAVEAANAAHDDNDLAKADEVLANVWLHLGETAQAIGALRAAENYYGRSGNTHGLVYARSVRVQLSFNLGEPVSASDVDELVATAQRLGNPRMEGVVEGAVARQAANDADYVSARNHYRNGESILQRIGDQVDAEEFGGAVGEMDVLLGDFDDARQRYAALAARQDTLGVEIWSASASYADLLAENGEPAAAIKAFDRTIAIGDQQSLPAARRARCQRGREQIALGHYDLAATDIDNCIAEELKNADTTGSKESAAALLTGLVGRAWLAHLHGEDNSALRQLAEAQALWEQAADITALDSIIALVEAYVVIAPIDEAARIVERFGRDPLARGAVHFQAVDTAFACALELRGAADGPSACAKLGDLSSTQSWRLKTRLALLQLCSTAPLASDRISAWLATTAERGDTQLLDFALGILQSPRFESRLSASLKAQLGQLRQRLKA